MNRTYLNDGWTFTERFDEAFLAGEGTFPAVRIPHTARELPLHYFDERVCAMVCGYRRTLFVPAGWAGKHIFLTFEGAAHQATLYVNGEKVCSHNCGYTAFTADLTERLVFGGDNDLCLRLDTTETAVPPFGGVIDYLTYGGVYRDVYVETAESECIADAFVHTDATAGGWMLRAELCAALMEEETVELTVADAAGRTVAAGTFSAQDAATGGPAPAGLCLPPETLKTLRIALPLPGIAAWSPETPVLYTASFTLHRYGRMLDTRCVRFGARTAEFRADGFYLNGKKMKLRGLNRHQCYPYVGYAMPDSMQRMDADILKNELGVNAVRTSHYPQSHAFLDRCDELGLVVFTEIPGWQHIGDDAWQDQAVENTREMVLQYRNHPSIVLWGVRINESQDDDAFYAQTNAAARALDPTRQTSGVRYLENSSLLEDVYAFNDFSHTGDNPGLRPRKKVTKHADRGYLVSEYNGHMFPTKPFDDEAHRTSHALRHANVLQAAYAQDNVAGCFGWCMFDYNTHKDFGSGDRVCYHGVTDLFRNPKLAAAVYGSQADEPPVCAVSSQMEIGEHPGGVLGKVYVFTNADSVRLYKNGKFLREFLPDRAHYGALPHPPVAVDDLIGDLLKSEEGYAPQKAALVKRTLQDIARYGEKHLPLRTLLRTAWLMLRYGFTYAEGYRLYTTYVANWGGTVSAYRFEAVKDSAVTVAVTRSPAMETHLLLRVDHTALREVHGYDVAAVRIEAVDQNGNRLPWSNAPLRVTVAGEIERIGPELIALSGGAAGVYVKSTGRTGGGILTVEGPDFPAETVQFTVKV